MPVVYRIWWLTSDCGRSFLRWALWTAILAMAFALAFGVVGLDLGDHPTRLSFVYFSVITMTTLGYGDVVPSTGTGQALAMFEVLVGYVMLGGLLSIFATKMGRRAE